MIAAASQDNPTKLVDVGTGKALYSDQCITILFYFFLYYNS